MPAVHILFCVLAVSLLSSHAKAGDTGVVTYPSEDLLNTRQGTIEFWFTVPWDVKERLPGEKKYTGLLALCDLKTETGGFNVAWFSGASYYPEAGLFSSISSSKLELHGSFLGKFMPPPMQWHHIAVTWKGDTFTYYLDGQVASTRVCLEDIQLTMGTVGGEPLRLGDKWHTRGFMIVDDLRLSIVARRADELGCHGPLKSDPFTTLLDDFESAFTPDGQTTTTPAWSFTGAAGVPSRQCRFVDGRFGKGLALYSQ